MSAEERRQQLIGIGLDLLETRPIHELALDEVAAAAGVSRTLVFHYFPSKADFYAAVVATAGRRLVLASPHVPDADVDTRLRAMVSAFLKFVQRKRGAYVALVRGAPGVDPQVMAELDEARATLVGLWLDAAEWPHRDEITQLAVRGWLGALEELALVASTSDDVPRSSVVELLVQGLLGDLAMARRLGQAQAGEQLPRVDLNDRSALDGPLLPVEVAPLLPVEVAPLLPVEVAQQPSPSPDAEKQPALSTDAGGGSALTTAAGKRPVPPIDAAKRPARRG